VEKGDGVVVGEEERKEIDDDGREKESKGRGTKRKKKKNKKKIMTVTSLGRRASPRLRVAGGRGGEVNVAGGGEGRRRRRVYGRDLVFSEATGSF